MEFASSKMRLKRNQAERQNNGLIFDKDFLKARFSSPRYDLTQPPPPEIGPRLTSGDHPRVPSLKLFEVTPDMAVKTSLSLERGCDLLRVFIDAFTGFSAQPASLDILHQKGRRTKFFSERFVQVFK